MRMRMRDVVNTRAATQVSTESDAHLVWGGSEEFAEEQGVSGDADRAVSNE